MNVTAWESADSRKAIIQVTSARCRQLRKSNYTLIVPYNRLNQTIQRITRTGGRIIQVTIQSASLFSFNTKSDELTTAVEILPVKEETTTETATTTVKPRRRKTLLERSKKIIKHPSKHRAKKVRRRTKLSS